MKKIIIIATLLLAFNANATVSDVRSSIATSFGNTINEIKKGYKSVEGSLTGNLQDSTNLKNEAIILKQRSEEPELNPKVLEHGKANVINCDYKKQNLNWDGKQWVCSKPPVTKDCEEGSDEYRYEKDGVVYCEKFPEDAKRNYYWKFRGYSGNCETLAEGFTRLYDCYYKNKQNAEVQVADKFCANINAQKPSATVRSCQASWSQPGSCSCSNRGFQIKSKTVYGTCPKGYICPGNPPKKTCRCQPSEHGSDRNSKSNKAKKSAK